MTTGFNLGAFAPRDAKKFAKDLLMKRATRGLHKALEELGPTRLEWHILNNKNLADTAPAELVQIAKERAKNYAWAAKLVSEQEVLLMIPDWVHVMVKKHGERGETWLTAQLGFARSLFFGDLK